MSFKKFKSKKDVKEKEAKSKYNEFKLENLIYYTSAILLVELQIKLNNYFMSHYEKCVSSIDGYPVIPKEEESEAGERFNYGINFFTCILDNLKKGDGYWKAIKKKKKEKINTNFRTILDVIAQEREYNNRLQKKRNRIRQHRERMDQIEQTYLWNEFRPYLNKIGELKEPQDLDLNDCDISTKKDLMRILRIADERNKWYSQKIFEKINSIIQHENVENVKYDPLPIGNSCCLDFINNNYDYYNFLYDKDKSKQLKDFIEKSRELEQRCSVKDFKLFYVKPTMIRPKLDSFYLEVFPERSKINKKVITKMFTTFVPHGINQGKKRIYEHLFTEIDNSSKVKIDVLTNSYLSDLEKEYTTEEFYNLLDIIHSNNKIEEKPEEIMEDDIYKFKVSKVTNDLKECLDNEYFKSNNYLKELVENELTVLANGRVSDIARIWEKLELEVRESTNSFMKNFDSLKTADKNKIETILKNLDNFELTDKSDESVMEDMESKITIEKLKRKENAFKDYIFNYIKKYVAMLSNNKKTNAINVNIRKRAENEFEVYDDFTDLNEFMKRKYNKVFKKVKEFTKTLGSSLKKLKGYDDIYDCENRMIHRSRFNYKNCIDLLRLIFIISLQTMVNMAEESMDEGDDSEHTGINISDDDEDGGIMTSSTGMILHFIKKLLNKLDKDRNELDKYNSKNNIREIKTRNELNKDKNLYVMQLLDLETRRLRNEQTKAGLVNYADLSKDFEDVLERDEMEQNVRGELGPDATDEQVENALKQRQIDNYELSQVETFNTAEGDDELPE